MSELSTLFSNDLIHLDLQASNSEELYAKVYQILFDKGFVNNGYLKGISEREKQFPTGLITQHLNIALPHSDCEYIEEAFVAIIRLENPITYYQMGDNAEMEVKDLLFLGIKDPSKQVGLLSSLMNLFMNEAFVNDYKDVKTKEEMFKLVTKNMEEL